MRISICLTVCLLTSVFQIKAQPTHSADETTYQLDFAPDVEDSVIVARIASVTDANIAISFNPKVRRFIDYFTMEDRDYTRKMLYRYKEYFPMFEAKLKKHNMPTDLKYLTIVESGINPKAKSHAGAAGLWQFMPYTGKSFKLKYDYYVDNRLDPEKATEAACNYLKELYGMFHDWEMALAAYNCGPGNIRKAIRRSGGKKTFWGIYNYLPKETRSYVPQFMAVAYVMRFAEDHNIYEDKIQDRQDFEIIYLNQYTNLEELAKALNVCAQELEDLNPEIKRNAITQNHANYQLRIPLRCVPFYKINKTEILAAANKPGKERLNTVKSGTQSGKVRIVHTVRRGEVLGKIAERYHVGLSKIKTWNGIGRSNVIRVGQKLEVYVSPAVANSTNKRTYTASSAAPGTYTVKRGDTLWNISRRYKGLSITKIKQLNNLTSDQLKVGQKLKLT